MGAHVVDYDSVGIPVIIKPPPPMPQGQARAYDPQAWRSAIRSTLAFSEGDIARGIARAMRDGHPASIVLASDIALSRPISLPSTLRSVEIDGGGFTISGPPEADFNDVFVVECERVYIQNTVIRPHKDAEPVVPIFGRPCSTSVFDVRRHQSDLSLVGILLDESLNGHGVFEYVFRNSLGNFVDIRPQIISMRIPDSNSQFQRITLMDSNINAFHGHIDTYGIALDSSLRTWCGITFGDGAPAASTVAIGDGAFVYVTAPVMFVTVSNTATGTFTFETDYDYQRTVGQRLTIVCSSKGTGTCSLSSTAYTRLNGTWTPNSVGDNITLLWCGTYWVEVARVDV
jgi:hypothetical protein